MEEEQFQKTPAKANRWFKAFIVLSLLYGITFSLHPVFNWIFFCAAGYSLFMSYFLLPVQPKIFQNGNRPNRAPFQREGRPTVNVDEPAEKVKKTVRIIVISVVGFFVFLIVVGIFTDDDQSSETTDTETTDESGVYDSSDNTAQTLTSKGNEFVNAGQNDSADVYYMRALEINPDFYEAIYGKGLVLYNRGYKDEANANFTRAYEGGYRFAWLSWVMADNYDKAGKTQKAIELYRESINLDSSYVDSYNRLAELLPEEATKFRDLAQKHTSN